MPSSCVKMLNSGAPGVMLDLEDSMANRWDHPMLGHRNAVAALYGELTYDDAKRGERSRSSRARPCCGRACAACTSRRPASSRTTPTSASLFDLALLVLHARLRAPASIRSAIYIPKSESAEEALWWRDVFDALVAAKGRPRGSIKAMALVESHPIAYQIEEFLYNLRDYILGLNLGRWDYMASLIHFNLDDPAWVLPDRNTIPIDVPFFQRVRTLMPEIAHKHGALAIGGMTALYPSREDPELNARALEVLERDKNNEAACLMDGAWTGHPDQNAIAVAQFPSPNQLDRRAVARRRRTPICGRRRRASAATTLDGTRAAVRTVIRYRHGVLEGPRREPARRLHGRSCDRSDLPADDRAARALSRARTRLPH